MDGIFSIGRSLTAQMGQMGSQFGDQLSAGLAKSTEFTRQRLGQAGDVTPYPPEFVRLRKRVQALEKAHARMLRVVSHYSTETYDYPTDLRETFTEMSRSVVDGLRTISQATSSEGVTAALNAHKASTPQQPRTLAHALSRAAFASAHLIEESRTEDPLADSSVNVGIDQDREDGIDKLAEALREYAIVCETIGEARLKQDVEIQNSLVSRWETISRTIIKQAIDKSASVDAARLQCDTAKSRARGNVFSIKGKDAAAPADASAVLTEEQQAAIARADEEFLSQVEDVNEVMNTALVMSESIKQVKTLVEAQMRFHKTAATALEGLLPLVDRLVDEQTEMEKAYLSPAKAEY